MCVCTRRCLVFSVPFFFECQELGFYVSVAKPQWFRANKHFIQVSPCRFISTVFLPQQKGVKIGPAGKLGRKSGKWWGLNYDGSPRSHLAPTAQTKPPTGEETTGWSVLLGLVLESRSSSTGLSAFHGNHGKVLWMYFFTSPGQSKMQRVQLQSVSRLADELLFVSDGSCRGEFCFWVSHSPPWTQQLVLSTKCARTLYFSNFLLVPAPHSCQSTFSLFFNTERELKAFTVVSNTPWTLQEQVRKGIKGPAWFFSPVTKLGWSPSAPSKKMI